MKLFDFLKRKKKPTRRRSYEAGAINRLLNNWTTTPKTADEAIKGNLRNMRARSRDLSRNNDYARKYGEMVKTNVVGTNGIVMQSKAKRPDGTFDKLDNESIEKAWKLWGRKPNCSVNGKLSWIDTQRCVVETVARDGEILIRKVRGADNPFGYALQLIECDHLDEDLNKEKYRGIRPAFGYPACPEHSEKEKLFEILDAESMGVELTENYSMAPAASVSGLYFSNKKSRYFAVGQ